MLAARTLTIALVSLSIGLSATSANAKILDGLGKLAGAIQKMPPKKTSSGSGSFDWLKHPYFTCVRETLNHVPPRYANDPGYQAATKQQCLKLHPFK